MPRFVSSEFPAQSILSHFVKTSQMFFGAYLAISCFRHTPNLLWTKIFGVPIGLNIPMVFGNSENLWSAMRESLNAYHSHFSSNNSTSTRRLNSAAVLFWYREKFIYLTFASCRIPNELPWKLSWPPQNLHPSPRTLDLLIFPQL